MYFTMQVFHCTLTDYAWTKICFVGLGLLCWIVEWDGCDAGDWFGQSLYSWAVDHLPITWDPPTHVNLSPISSLSEAVITGAAGTIVCSVSCVLNWRVENYILTTLLNDIILKISKLQCFTWSWGSNCLISLMREMALLQVISLVYWSVRIFQR